MEHYLDYNATAPLRPQVLAVMQELQSVPLNPSSVHKAGRRAKSIVEDARRTLAEIVGAFPAEIVFTASGTEANNWVLRAFSDRPLFVSAIEHSSVLKTAQSLSLACGGIQGGTFNTIPVTPHGVMDMEALEKCLPNAGNFLVSLMLANNETGVIQPVREAAQIVHARGGLLHCDAVQGFGKIPVDFTALGCDLMTLSAHKMGGPAGAAALIVKNNLPLLPMLTGGGQELNRRAGTENVAAIAGFAKAAERIDFAQMKKLRRWLDAFENEINEAVIPAQAGRSIIGSSAPRLPNTTCVTMPDVAAETQLISFDLAGIAVSAGSACSSGRIEPSHVLRAMGLDASAASTAIRISGGWSTTEGDIAALSAAWKKLFHVKNRAA